MPDLPNIQTKDITTRRRPRQLAHAEDAAGYSFQENLIRMDTVPNAERNSGSGGLCPGKADEARTGRGFESSIK